MSIILTKMLSMFTMILPPSRVETLLKLLELIVFGAFGGCVYAIVTLLEAGKTAEGWTAARGCKIGRYVCGQALVGVGGAFAALFGILTLGNTVHTRSTGDFTDTGLYFASLCVVGGFIGNRLLVGVGERMAKQLTDVKKDTAQAMSTAREAESKAVNAETVATEAKDVALATLIGRNLVERLEKVDPKAIPADLRSDADTVLTKLNDYRKILPTDRSLYIVIANLAFLLNRAADAFAHLEEFLSNRKSAGISESKDDAAGWYNIGCFYSLLASADLQIKGYTKIDETPEELQNKAIKAIKRCLTISKRCGPDALASRLAKMQGDHDLDNIANTKEFKQMIARISGDHP